MKILIKICCAMLVLACSLPTHAASTFDNLVVFGDSLSDTGNMYRKFFHRIPKSPPYHEGHFSDELMWPEYFADEFPGIRVTNMAYGAAETSGTSPVPGLVEQVDQYLKKAPPLNKELFAILIGANNYYDTLVDARIPSKGEITHAVTDISKAVQALANKGAKNIMVIDLPDLGFTPRGYEVDTENHNDAYSKNGAAVTKVHNDALHLELDKLRKSFAMQNKHVQIISVDTPGFVEQVVNEVLTNPTGQKYFDVVPGHKVEFQKRCYTGDYFGKGGTICAYPHEYMFWDVVHPSSAFHKILAKRLAQLLVEDFNFKKMLSMELLSVEDENAINEFNNRMFY